MTEETASPDDVNPDTSAADDKAQLTDEEQAAMEAKEASGSDGEQSDEGKEAKAPEKAEEAEPEPDPKPKKKVRPAAPRIRELVDRAKDAEAKQAEAERRAKRAEQRLASLTSSEPKAGDYDLGEDDPKYIAELAVFRAAQGNKTELEQDAQDAKEDTAAAKNEAIAAKKQAFEERADEFRQSADDFDEVVFNPRNEISPIMGEMILESEYGPQISYYLGKHPREAAQIASLTSEREVARHFGRIEADFIAPIPKQVTAAPTPIKPVATQSGRNTLSPDEMSVDDMESHLKKTGVIN